MHEAPSHSVQPRVDYSGTVLHTSLVDSLVSKVFVTNAFSGGFECTIPHSFCAHVSYLIGSCSPSIC